MNIEWSEQYGIHSARIGRLVFIEISWQKGAYVGKVSGYNAINLKPCPDFETAKRNTLTVALMEAAKLHETLLAELIAKPATE
jgi:hypothetical protein